MDKKGGVKKALIPAVIILIIFMSYFVMSATKGRFVIGNEPPYVVADTFAVKDGPAAGNWDNSVIIDTHDKNTKLRFNVKDPNPNNLNARLCIGTSANPSATAGCNVINYDGFAQVTPGQHQGAAGAQINYEYGFDPLGTLEGIPEAIGLTQADCSGASCSKTFYLDIIIDDNDGQITTTSFSFNIINNVPATPSVLTPSQTHDQTPDLSWVATDPDDGSIDKWPADILTYNIQAGATTFGDTDYLDASSLAVASSTVVNPIPWGTPGATQAITTAYARIWSTDNFGIISFDYDTAFNLVDNLPVFDDIHLSDTAIIGNDASCTEFVDSCPIVPLQGNTTSVNVIASVTDADVDCASIPSTTQVVLCLIEDTDLSTCDLSNNAYRTYTLTYNSAISAAENCNFSLSLPISDVQGIEFYQLPKTYKLFVEPVDSQAGASTTWISGGSANHKWKYNSLPYLFNDPDIVLGDPSLSGGDDIQLGQWNPGLNEFFMVNRGNVLLNIEWEATDPRNVDFGYICPLTSPDCCLGDTTTNPQCWDLSTYSNQFQIDDENAQGESTEILQTPLVFPEWQSPSLKISFKPITGLEICDSMLCNSPVLNEDFSTYFHINPPVGLSTGTYETDIAVIYSQL
ncbi:hypothetical protein J4225_02895 [Candidatus Pacearchaeota archaeon]|nr:hypothetical protein [uncultured archaeon]MBS3085608.1 hypothetical protein [Candidatus Pacearchaeota archaeon]